jgi:hypothetical protein
MRTGKTMAIDSTSSRKSRINRAMIERAVKAAAKDASSGRAELQSGKYKPSPAKR